MNALITGYKGFIGKNLSKELNRLSYNLLGIEKDVVKHYLDNESILENMIKDSDIIFHVGAISDTSEQDYNEMLYYNYHFTKKLVDLSEKLKVKIIYSSSASVYGNGGVNDVPNNIYAWSKLMAEDYGRRTYPEGFVSLRYFNVYGPHEEHKLAKGMCSVGYKAWKCGNQKLFPKKPARDFVYVKDVVSANIAAIEVEAGIYEVGTGNARTFEDFLDNMGRVPYTYTDELAIPEWYQYFTEANSSNWLPNWEPKYNLEAGCADYLMYLNNER